MSVTLMLFLTTHLNFIGDPCSNLLQNQLSCQLRPPFRNSNPPFTPSLLLCPYLDNLLMQLQPLLEQVPARGNGPTSLLALPSPSSF